MSWLTRLVGNASARTPKSAQQHHAQLRLESLEDRTVPTVNYYGGAVLTHVEAQALFLGSDWSNVSTYKAETTTLNNFLGNVTGGAYMDALTSAGYGVGRGTASAGVIDNTTYKAGSMITDASIQAKIQADIKSGLLQAPDANRLYIVYVDPNVAVNLGSGQGTTQQGILGYHGAFAGIDAAGNARVIHYAVVVTPGGAAHNSSLSTSAIDQLTAVSSHEIAEAVTDPNVNYGQLGWYDSSRGEIGDITENNPNALVRLNGYLVQEVANQYDQLLSINTGAINPPPSTAAVSTISTLKAGAVHYQGYYYPVVTLTVVVKPTSGNVQPSGLVELIYQGQVLGTAQIHISNGVALATFAVQFLSSGSYTFSTQYMGATGFLGSTSNSVTVNV